MTDPIQRYYDSFSATVRSRARHIREDGGAVDADPTYGDVWWITSANLANRPMRPVYRVQLIVDGEDVYATCTCQHGGANPGHARCYHVAAAIDALTETATFDWLTHLTGFEH